MIYGLYKHVAGRHDFINNHVCGSRNNQHFHSDALGIAIFALMMPLSGNVMAAPPKAQQVTVTVAASDPINAANKLHYAWHVSEGSITNVDSATTSWTIPTGPGVHFANVLVSNSLGGYTDRRIALISDNLGISAITSPVKDFVPPASNQNAIQSSETEFVVASDTNYLATFNAGTGLYGNGTGTFNKAFYIPDIKVNYTDTVSNIIYQATTDLSGRLSVWNSNHPICCDDGNFPYGHPHTHVNAPVDASGNVSGDPMPYIVGSAVLSDGGICGIDSKFHNVQSTAKAVLLDKNKRALSASVRANKYGDYAIPWNANAFFVSVTCESNAPIIVPIKQATSVANLTTFTKAAAPVVKTMTASIGGQVLGTTTKVFAKFLPPDSAVPSSSPSSNFPRPDHYRCRKKLRRDRQT